MSDLDCQKCGACCIEQLVVLMDGDDVPYHMVTDKADIKVEHEDGLPKGATPLDLCVGLVMRQQLGRCIALEGKIGVDVSCKIYDNRPAVCKVMKAGAWACREVRARSYVNWRRVGELSDF